MQDIIEPILFIEILLAKSGLLKSVKSKYLKD